MATYNFYLRDNPQSLKSIHTGGRDVAISVTGDCIDSTASGSDIGDINLYGFCTLPSSSSPLNFTVQLQIAGGPSATFWKDGSHTIVARPFDIPSCRNAVTGWQVLGAGGKQLTFKLNDAILQKCNNPDPPYVINFQSKEGASWVNQTYDPIIKHGPGMEGFVAAHLIAVVVGVLGLGALGLVGFLGMRRRPSTQPEVILPSPPK